MENKNLMIGIGAVIIILLVVNGIFWIKSTGSVVIEKHDEVSEEIQEIFDESSNKIFVDYVIDGDTIKLSTGEEVRLIGINAPEKGEKCYEEAKEYLKEWTDKLDGEVILEKDVEDKDQYGRLLRYIIVNKYNVNKRMVLEGFAHKYEYGSDIKYSSEFEEAENIAKENCGCIWQPCIIKDNETENEIPNYITDKCFTITEFHFNAAGDDNYNLNDEYVTLKNTCDYSINMDNWTIKDETSREDHKYHFPQFSIEGKNSVTLYTGQGTNTFTFEGHKVYWGRSEGDYGAIWNNGGDTLFLRDNQENLVLSKTYEGY